ncbi:MAG TPA: MoaD/ThiS family protein [Firmicutes bacterium]|nr:MoaD/ThiS family protein [Bacillota bacterium]
MKGDLREDSMKSVKVRMVLRGGLAAYVSGKSEYTVEAPCGARLRDLLMSLGVPLHEVMGAASGGRIKRLDEEVLDGESLELFPVISGG